MILELSGTSVYASANGIRHHLLRYGEAFAPALLLLPGITSPAATADFIAARLAKLGFCVFVPDLRGRGQTEVTPAGSYRMIDYAADVAGLVEELGLQRPILIGHSLGARIAAAYLALHAPRDHGLAILVDPPLSGHGRGPYPTSLASFMQQLDEAREGTTMDAMRRFYPKWPERELAVRMAVLPCCDRVAVQETHAGFESEDFLPHWRTLSGPALLVHGMDSLVVTATGIADLAAANPHVPMVGVQSAGHMIPWDNFEGFFAAISPTLAAQKAS